MTKVTAVKDNRPQAKKNIIQVAREFFSEYGYLGTSMSDLATRLNMTKAALYYHFAGKAEIFKTVLDEAFAELSQGTLLADAVSILGSLDLVIPEIDR